MVTEKKTETKPTEQQPQKDDQSKVKPKPVEDEDLSEEDKQLKDELLLCVQRLTESDEKLYKPALEILRTKIKESTSSMTSVPKPLKFLRNQYDTLKSVYEKIHDKTTKVLFFSHKKKKKFFFLKTFI